MMKITKFGHACLLVEDVGARVLIDPGVFSKGFEDLRELDAVLITHQHPDHVTPDTLATVRGNNPEVAVFADEGTVKLLEAEGVRAIKAVHAGDEFEINNLKVAIFGTEHAIIHPAIPGIENVGYMLAGKFFYPGDNFTDPGVPVEILALPLGAPWLKVSEVIDYVLAVKPKVAIPVHDAVLAMPQMHSDMVKKFAHVQGIDVKVVQNGETTEV